MAYETKPGNGALFKNLDKDEDKHPDYKGDAVLPDGTSVWLSAWLKEGTKGKFMSIAIKVKDAKPKTSTPAAKPAVEDDFDSVPF